MGTQIGFLTFLLHQATTVIGIAHMMGQAVTDGCMIDHLTVGIDATDTGTGITALLVNTRTVAAAVRVASTFGSTNLIGIAIVVGQTLANTESPLGQANGICATGIGLTGQWIGHRFWWFYTSFTSITHQTFGAVAKRTVNHGTAQGTMTTAGWTRIHALAVHAGLVCRTVGTAHALWSTERWGAYVISETGAACSTLWSSHTLGVRATGRGLTWVHFDGISNWKN